MNTLKKALIILLFLGGLSGASLSVFGQTPGMIYEPSTSVAGRAVLDSNSDGYTSKNTAGFITNDETESEVPFAPLVFPAGEPDSDLGPGPDCGFTDFVQQTPGVQDAAQYYLSKANN